MPTQRGSRWQGLVYHASLPTGRVRRAFETKREAIAWEIDTKARLERGEPIDIGEAAREHRGLPRTLGELREYVITHHWSQARGVETAKINSNAIVKALGPYTPIARVTRQDIEVARSQLINEGGHPTTVNKKVSCLSLMLSTAVDLGIIPAKPPFPKPFKELEGKQLRFTKEDETKALAYFAHIGHELMADYVIFSVDTGLRQGEVLKVTGEDYNGKSIFCWGEWTKSGKSRSVPLTSRAKAVVERRLEANAGNTRLPLFGKLPLAGRAAPGLTKEIILHYWEGMKTALGYADLGSHQFTPHLMRHEFCSRLADRGVNAPLIKDLAGHSNLMTTQRYIRVNGAAMEAAMAALEAA